jgi:hypothetical protein
MSPSTSTEKWNSSYKGNGIPFYLPEIFVSVLCILIGFWKSQILSFFFYLTTLLASMLYSDSGRMITIFGVVGRMRIKTDSTATISTKNSTSRDVR